MIRLQFEDEKAFSSRERAHMEEVSAEAEPAIRKYLPALTHEIVVNVSAGTRVIPEVGHLGVAQAPGVISWRLDPSHRLGTEAIISEGLRPTLFHECHHLVRGWVIRGMEPPTTFMHGVVCEGLATAFERDAGGARPLWGEYPNNVREWAEELLTLPVDEPYQQWMFSHPDGRRWIGYRAGTFIADQATFKSALSSAELVRTPTEEILKLSGVVDGTES